MKVIEDLGSRAIIPHRVAREVAKPRTPLERLLERSPNIIRKFVPGSEEEQVYYDLTRDNGPRLGDGEAAAIAIARNRGAVLVTDDAAALERAAADGVRTMTTEEFLGAALL